jgi:dihydroorotate dehydrogenase (fumarate)
MADLGITYMGIPLANPVIAGASDLTANMDAIKRMEQAGAGALVLKSLFEEQIQLERFKLEEDQHRGEAVYAEMASIFPKFAHAGPREHLMWVAKSKAAVKIPVFASLNAVNKATWVEYAKALADQGVDGLELNFFATPRDSEMSGAGIEEEQLETVGEIISAVKIPVAVKLSPFYSNPLNFIMRMDRAGVKGLVLFNRLFHPDIDVESQSIIQPFNFSTHSDNRLPLRYSGLLYGKVKSDIIASTGVMTAADAVKMLLAGATAVQVVTTLYRHGIAIIERIGQELSRWMQKKEYSSVAEFRGRLSQKNIKDPWTYTRAQYAKMLLDPKEFMEPVKPY